MTSVSIAARLSDNFAFRCVSVNARRRRLLIFSSSTYVSLLRAFSSRKVSTFSSLLPNLHSYSSITIDKTVTANTLFFENFSSQRWERIREEGDRLTSDLTRDQFPLRQLAISQRDQQLLAWLCTPPVRTSESVPVERKRLVSERALRYK